MEGRSNGKIRFWSCPGKDQHFCFLFGHLLSLTKIAVRIADIQIVPGHEQRMRTEPWIHTIWYKPEIILKGDYEGETSD